MKKVADSAMSDKIAFYSKDVSDNLEIATSILRKWSAMLEDAGYPFKKNDKRTASLLRRLC